MKKVVSIVLSILGSPGKVFKKENFTLHTALKHSRFIRICGQGLHAYTISSALAKYVKIIHAKVAMRETLARTMMIALAITTVDSSNQRDSNGRCARLQKDKALIANLTKNAKIT